MHDDLIALFDFAIEKTDEEINNEKRAIINEIKPYFRYNKDTYSENRKILSDRFEKEWNSKYPERKLSLTKLKDISKQRLFEIFDTVFFKGIIEVNQLIENQPPDKSIIVLTDNIAVEKDLGDLFTIKSASEYIKNEVEKTKNVDKELLKSLLNTTIFQNVIYDNETTQREKKLLLDNISITRGMVQNGERIISKGELITSDKFIILESLKKEYESQFGLSSSFYLILTGQFIWSLYLF